MHSATVTLTPEDGEPLEETVFIPPNLRSVDYIEKDFRITFAGFSQKFSVRVAFDPALITVRGRVEES